MLLVSAALAQDVSIRDPLATGTTATTVYGGTFTGSGWRVDDSNSRLFWDLGTQVERGTVSFTTTGIDLNNLTGDNNEFIQLFDTGDKWSCTHAITMRVYGSDDGDQQGDIKLKTWDNASGLFSEARGGVQVWDGNPHTWTITWDATDAVLYRDGAELIHLDVTGQDLRVGTMWLPLNAWTGGYSHPIGSVYSNLSLDAWEPSGPTDDTGTPVDPGDGRVPIEDVGAVEALGSAVYDAPTDLPLQDTTERSYLMFDLSDLSGTVTSATLTLHAQSDSHAEGDGGTVYAVGDTSWSEDTLTWPTKPELGVALANFGAVHSGDTIQLDVTPGVRAGGRVAFAIANGGGNGAHFWSKEGDHPPTLDVTVTEPPADSGGGGSDTDVDADDTGYYNDAGDTGDGTDRAGHPGGKTSWRPTACGCATSSSAGTIGWLAVAGALVMSRRRR